MNVFICACEHQRALSLSVIVLPINLDRKALFCFSVRFNFNPRGKTALADFSTQTWVTLPRLCGRNLPLFFNTFSASRMFSAHWLTHYKLVSPKLHSWAELETLQQKFQIKPWCSSKDVDDLKINSIMNSFKIVSNPLNIKIWIYANYIYTKFKFKFGFYIQRST